MFPIGHGWLISLSSFNACCPLVKPTMAFFSTSKFETQLPQVYGRIHLLDENVLAFDDFVILIDDAPPPFFLHHLRDDEVQVMRASPIPLPSYLPRPQ